LQRLQYATASVVEVESSPMLLEREDELRELQKALYQAQRERGQFVLIEGAAGLGKTSLLRATLQSAAQLHFTCLRARASELEHDFPYGCVRQLLEQVIARLPPAERERLFEGAAALAAPLFAPGVSLQAAAADSAYSMLHGLYWLLNNLTSNGPVALWVDDLHWADPESLRFLAYLAPRLDGLPLAVFASARARENVTAPLAGLFVQPENRVLRLEPLTVEATASLCELRLGSAVEREFAAACHGATGGNPFFLDTLLREAKELRFLTDAREAGRVRRFGPVAVTRTVLLRLSAAPPPATALVRALAVLGDGARIAEAARMAELSADEAARMADLLVTLAILKQAEGLEFAHSIVREAVYSDIGPHERARAHARAALILTEAGAADERVATQIVQAEPAGDAERVELLRRAAAGALGRGAPAAAVVWLERALAEPPPVALKPQVLLELGSAELRLALPEAGDHLAAAVAAIREPSLLTQAVRQLANALGLRGDADGAALALESAIARVEPENADLALVLEAELAAKATQARREVRALATARLARHANLRGASAGERLVLASLAFERARASETSSEAVAHIERALASSGLFSGEQPDVVGPFYALVIGLLDTDAPELAARYLDQALAGARARGSVVATAFLTVHGGWFCLRRGLVAQAEADARAALDLMSAHDIRLGSRFALALLLQALIERGQLDVAEQGLQCSTFAGEIPPGLANNTLFEARGLLHLAQGRARAALADLHEFGRRDELWGAANPLASRWRSHACFALLAAGEPEQARQLAATELERARRWGAASGIGVALRAAALVEGGEAAIARLSEAVGVLQRSPATLEYARALADLGAAQRRANRRSEARTTLQTALALARRNGADALAERVSTELRAAGGRSTDAAATGLDRLTVSERRVAELVAKGQNNPQIAQALFVTRKTIETHLSHIYSKLNISGRLDLARALAAEPATAVD
jgi:DNA-binding CsgD family transcriptional regulator